MDISIRGNKLLPRNKVTNCALVIVMSTTFRLIMVVLDRFQELFKVVLDRFWELLGHL